MPRSLKPTVFVVDDDQDVRNALRWLLESVGQRVETFPSAERFLAHYTPTRSGCIVLDVRMPGIGGLGLLERLRDQRMEIPVIMLTGHADVPMAVRAMKLGALDFFEKPFADQELLDRIQAALRQDAQRRRQMSERADIAERLTQLTPREREVLDQVLTGTANKAISVNLGISERTVESHRKRIMEKMQARSLAELVRMGLVYTEVAGKT
jgi:RNA polymerase sigma factor (sigma-70 family)